MKALLDTHTILWAGLTPSRLGKEAAELLAEQENELLVSAASIWEIATKVRLGRMPEAEAIEGNLLNRLREAGYIFRAITAEDALRAGRLVGEHQDPFDRMIAAQALSEDLPVVSLDTKLDGFGVRRIW